MNIRIFSEYLHFYANMYVYENNIMKDVSETEFDPNGTLKRAVIVTVLYRLEGESEVSGDSAFSDVQPSAWFSDSIERASANGTVKGYSEGR